MAVALISIATHFKTDEVGRLDRLSCPKRKTLGYGRRTSQRTGCPSPLLYQPRSEENALVKELIESLEKTHLGTSWISLVPSRIGHSSSIDFATKAAIASTRYSAGLGTDYNSCLRSYITAISRLRMDLDTDNLRDLNDSLLAAALLFHAEVSMDPKTSSLSAHPRGMSSILMKALRTKKVQRKGDFSTTCVVASHILYFNWKSTFEAPVAQGRASPFDAPHWLDMEPVFYGNLPQDVKSLRKLSHQLFIKLPHLIAMVRSLRDREVDADMNGARALAIELSNSLEDKESENEVLHRINVRQTTNESDTPIIPFHFHYDDMNIFEAAMYYWQARIMLYRLCIKLLDLDPNIQFGIDRSTLTGENQRMAVNMMMSWPFAFEVGMMGNWATCVGFVGLWGTTVDTEEFRIGNENVPMNTLRTWILAKYNALYRGFATFREDDLDGSSDLLVGGELKCFTVPMRYRKQYMALYSQRTNLEPTDWMTSFK